MKSLRKCKIKIFIFVLTGILLCLGNWQRAYAEDTLQIGIDQYEVLPDGYIQVYVNQNTDGKFDTLLTDSLLLIGKNKLEIEEVKSFSDADEAVTYLCLIDISGSMTDDGIEQTKKILTELVESKGGNDNVCITTMGNDVSSSGFLTDTAKLKENIEGIERISSEDTNLYYGITEALNELKTDKQVNKKRCLLIFSDGEDDQKKGITEKEAQDAVKDSHIPIFTVALKGKNLKNEEESTKILGSFARNSAGGDCYMPLLDESYDYDDVCGKIKTRLQTSLILKASLDGIKEMGDDTVRIEVSLSDGTKEATDGITVPAGNIKEAIEAASKRDINYIIKEGSEGEQETTETGTVEVSNKNEKSKYIVFGGIGVVIVIIILIIVLLSGKKQPESNQADKELYNENYGSAEVSWQPPSSDMTMAPGTDSGGSSGTQAQKGKGRIQVTLYKVGPNEDKSYQITLKGEALIGRNKECQLSLADDSALSGKHCSLIYRDGNVYVRDENSTNGTYANGVPVLGEYKVEKDDILLIGSSEYRIYWE